MKTDQLLIKMIQNGLPLVSHPYAAIGEQIGLTEAEVIAKLNNLIDTGVIKRFGIVVYHRKLGYQANAMVVWDIPDTEVDLIGQKLGQYEFVTLCYRRSRHLPDWPYNLYCMIHGMDKNVVLQELAKLIEQCNLSRFPHQVLFSKHCFKQRGAYYSTSNN
ncbi:MAG: AsnC family protein [Proteobacteria bacterium]|nr:AsnC family protein [Pseudomonadota bacterium]